MRLAGNGEGRFTFDIASCVVADVETYPGRWCVGFRGMDRGGSPTSWVVDGDLSKLRRTLARFAEGDRIMVTYNGDQFDVPVIRHALAGHDPFAVGDAIIAGSRLPAPTSSLAALPCEHIDLAARLRHGGRIPSLKLLAAYGGRPMLRELPFAPGTDLSDEQWAEVVRYNEIDLGHTWFLLERFAPELQALAAISDEEGQDLRSEAPPRVVEHVFVSAYRQQRGGEPTRPPVPAEVAYRPVTGVRRPRTPEAAAWAGRIFDATFAMVGEGDRKYPDVPRAQFRIGGLEIGVGSGGLHSVDSPRVHYTTRKAVLYSVDVASYYPTLIATKGIGPRAMGEVWSKTFCQILERRLDAKRRAKTAVDDEERRRLVVQSDGLKLLLNSTSGKFGDRYSVLFDPAAYLTVTLSGQLMLIDLIERLDVAGARVLSANTDGLFVKVRCGDRRWRKALKRWQADTEMTLEVDPLRRLAILASNRFATLSRAGAISRKGAGLKGDFRLSPLAAPNGFVIADAVAEALLRDVPPERTVTACADPVRFCSVTRRSGKVRSAVLTDGKREQELPKVARWYKAAGSNWRIEHRLEGGRRTTPADAVGVGIALDLTDGTLPSDLDADWYIARAREVVHSVPGYRHRSFRRLQGHPDATALLEAGLVPYPIREGEAPPAAGRPTYLWDWGRYSAFGTYTGQASGLLVLDVGEPRKFRAFVDGENLPLLGSFWRDFDGCLVSCRGDVPPEDVRRGRACGRLLFRLAAEAVKPPPRPSRSLWLKSRGAEAYYGAPSPVILGSHDGGVQRMSGRLGEAPSWLIERLGSAKPSRGGAGNDD